MVFKLAILALVVTTLAAVEIESRGVETVPMVIDVLGSPAFNSRNKRGAYRPYPQRTMMFTGFYRPTRRSDDDQAGGVYAQGGSVSGGAYFGQPNYLKDEGPRPIDESEIAKADAEASPVTPENQGQDEQQAQEPQSDEQPQYSPDKETENPIFQDSPKSEKPSHKQPTKTKKNKQIPAPSDDENDEYDTDEEDEPPSLFRPGKGKPDARQYPSLNNFFPMVFSFPRGTSRRRGSSSDSEDSIPGLIAAIANSYSTGKGGVASSVATAYGGSPTKKQRRPSQSASSH